MKHLFVPYELAVKLKEKGYKEYCLAHYTLVGRLLIVRQTGSTYQGVILAPLYQQIIDWFSEEHNIELYCPNYYKNSKGYKPEYECRVNGKQSGIESSSSSSVTLFPTRHEAFDEAIKEALKII